MKVERKRTCCGGCFCKLKCECFEKCGEGLCVDLSSAFVCCFCTTRCPGLCSPCWNLVNFSQRKCAYFGTVPLIGAVLSNCCSCTAEPKCCLVDESPVPEGSTVLKECGCGGCTCGIRDGCQCTDGCCDCLPSCSGGCCESGI